MKPYFMTHPIGILYLLTLLGWYLTEIVQLLRQQQWRKDAARVRAPGFWLAFCGCVAVTIAVFVFAPAIAPAAEIGHAGVAFVIGMVMLVTGAAIRIWAFQALGRYFTFTVKVSPDQPVVAAGPYRLIRHPGYAGGLLATTGLGVLYGNWLSVATIAILWTALISWRIHAEERALLTGVGGDRYRAYAATRKRLIPLVW